MDTLFWANLLNGLLMVAMPIGLAIFLTRKFGLEWRLWWIGATTFVLSQVGHIPFLWISTLILNRLPLAVYFQNAPKVHAVVFNGVFLGLAAGLFEELFRYGMYRWWVKDAHSWGKGLLTGAGHGGAEAIIFGVLALYAFIQLAILRNVDLSTLFSGEKLELVRQQVQTYWSASWYDAVLGAVERLFAIAIQLCCAVLVLQTFTRRQWFWVWLAVLYHAIIYFFTVPAAAGYISRYATEAIVGGFAIMSVIFIFLLRQPEPAAVEIADRAPALSGVEKLAGFTPKPIEETEDNLEKTRYQ